MWSDPAITKDPNNKFLNYFITNPLDVLNEVGKGGDLTAPDISGGYAATYTVLVSTTYVNAFENKVNDDAAKILKNEQATVIYDNE